MIPKRISKLRLTPLVCIHYNLIVVCVASHEAENIRTATDVETVSLISKPLT